MLGPSSVLDFQVFQIWGYLHKLYYMTIINANSEMLQKSNFLRIILAFIQTVSNHYTDNPYQQYSIPPIFEITLKHKN